MHVPFVNKFELKEMMEAESSSKKRPSYNDYGFMDLILSWSIEDIFNEELYKKNVEKIELTFDSIDHYMGSYKYPLLEETRAQLCSSMEIMYQAPFAEVIGLQMAKPTGKKMYDVKISGWQNRFTQRGETYRTSPGDVLVLTDCKSESVKDLQRFGVMWNFVSFVKTREDGNESDSVYFKIRASKDIDNKTLKLRSLFLVFLTNVNPNGKIWNALHMTGNLKLVKQILCTKDEFKESCSCSSLAETLGDDCSYQRLSAELNESQNKAIHSCLSGLDCNHNSIPKLIWGPPGTGKTKTLATLLFALLKMKYRVLVCAPTNVAIRELASRFLSIVRDTQSGDLFCSPGDLLLLGNNERLNIDADIEEIHLDSRIEHLMKCFAPFTGWSSSVKSMIDLLVNSVSQYHRFVENERDKEKYNTIGRKTSNCSIGKHKQFIEFVRERFLSTAVPLKSCISILCTHVARSLLLEHNYRNLVSLNEALKSFQDALFENNRRYEGLELLFSRLEISDRNQSYNGISYNLYKKRNECLSALETARDSLDRLKLIKSFQQDSIRKFCFQSSSIIFCTTTGSYKLHSVEMKPLNFLVIDEAAQLKESESVIPLLLPGISRAILVGDERQLPSMVRSNVASEAGFGRSLFERLSLLDHPKHLLNMQHRMHPQISSFPNRCFYSNQICDAPNVMSNYGKRYLPGPLFGPYNFINIIGGIEEFDDAGRSYKNMAEVAVVVAILKNLYKEWLSSKEKLCIGIVSPYAGQVVAIQAKLGKMHFNREGFNVNVKSIDGYQGGEQDIIILTTVRTNIRTSLEFVSSPQRTNVALTRARHCLWILGSERALANHENVWKDLVLDCKNRKCFFDADQVKELAKAILDSKREVDQYVDLLDTNSVLFKGSRWKVQFNDNFLRSFKRIRTDQSKNLVINLLQRISNGWRPNRTSVDLPCEKSSQNLKQFKSESRYVICSIEIVKESRYIQVLRIWDILPLEDIPKLVKRLDNAFTRYTDEYINMSKEKGFDGIIEFPLSWPLSARIQKFKGNDENERDLNHSEERKNDEKVEESRLLVKYSSFSQDYMLSGNDASEVDLPSDVTDEQRDIIRFPRSTFVLGRSGTGKTTVLTTKMIQNEKLHHMAVEAAYGSNCYASESKEVAAETERPVLRQLFVTLSPGLCQEVKHHVSRFQRSLCKGSMLAGCSSVVEDIGDGDTIGFKNIPDSFSDVPSNLYPLVITFRKFLLMLDGTLGNSYFERFNYRKGPKSVALETFKMKKEVDFERFDSVYWPHFNSQLIKKLDSYEVFTEIMSHIKGGSSEHGKLSQEEYCNLSENQASSLTMQTREMIYNIFQNYEKMKVEKGEFDLPDIVVDLHGRLRTERYKGDEMNFVFIDEVQDLTMSQIALFKHMCRNVEEGFLFCGDTAQTIGRGIDFRFQDVRSLFYKKFLLESKSWSHGKRHVSDIFMLSRNFRSNALVLKLSQSLIELLIHFFPNSVDMLKVETSLVHGEAPIVLESRNGENPLVTIFGGSGYMSWRNNIQGFGADQVILVRDDSTREEIMQIVGKKSLVLTILECKGLEFQDVFLYKFFASSPLKRRWWIIYEYMKEKNMLDSKTHINTRSFVDSKHNLLCSELKLLYVATTRSRKRLWICDDGEDFAEPMFDYWKKKNLVQFKILDSSVAESMKVASSEEEWRSRGMKLYHQNKIEMATTCFERAQWLRNV